MMEAHSNSARLHALMAMGLLAAPRLAFVSSYDPDKFTVKVKLQPYDTETGWIPIVTLMAGDGFGVFCAPDVGAMCVVAFIEGSVEVGFCIGFLPYDQARPPKAITSGEILIQHKSGSYLDLLNNGTAVLKAGGVTATLASGTLAIQGHLTATGNITDNVDGNDASMKIHRDAYNTHQHTGVQTGGGVSGTTTEPVT